MNLLSNSINHKFCVFVVLTIAFACSAVWAAPKALVVGDFSSGIFDEWEEDVIQGQTEYRITEITGIKVLQASAKNSASALIKNQRIDLWQTPVLNWRWKVDNRLPLRNETTKEGDDYPAGIYVIYDFDRNLWQSKSLAYVWTRRVTKGSTWRNANNVQNMIMTSMRDGSDETEIWHTEKRNILKDLQQFVDPAIRYIDAIAVMSDSDATNSFVNAFYGDIYFTAE